MQHHYNEIKRASMMIFHHGIIEISLLVMIVQTQTSIVLINFDNTKSETPHTCNISRKPLQIQGFASSYQICDN